METGTGFEAGGDVEARPLEVGDTIQEAFRAVGENFLPFAVIGALVTIPGLIVGLVISVVSEPWQERLIAGTVDPEELLSVMGVVLAGYFAFLLVYIALYAFGQGAAMFATVEHLVGRKASLGDALRAGLSRFLSLFACSFLVGLVTGFGAMFCLVPGIVAWIWLSAALPAVAVEGVGPIAAMQRSVELTEGHRVTIFLVYLVLFLAYMGFSFCIVGPATMIAAAGVTPGEMPDPLSPGQLMLTGLNGVLQIVIFMIATAVNAVIYARLRGLRDGVDANALARVFS